MKPVEQWRTSGQVTLVVVMIGLVFNLVMHATSPNPIHGKMVTVSVILLVVITIVNGWYDD